MKQCLSWTSVDGLMLRCTKRRGHYGGTRKHKNGLWRWWTTTEGKWRQEKKPE